MLTCEKTYDIAGYENSGFFRYIRVDANDAEQAKRVALENGIIADYVQEVTLEELEQEVIDMYESLQVENTLG